MTYTWTYLQENPREAKRLIGISYQNLMELMEMAKSLDKKHREKVEQQKTRLIQAGGGAKPKLSVEDQIVLTLIYLRQSLTFQVLGLLFQVSESTANNIFNYWLKILEDGLPPSLIEQVRKNEENEAKLSEILTEYELIVDSAEQEIPRPKDYQEQKKFYSGKKKNHTLKNQLIVLPHGADIVDLSAGKRGPESDINLWREQQDVFSQEQKFSGDKAYVGEAQIKTPIKKPKKGELTAQQKEENKQFSSLRVCVEHVIRTVKTFRSAGDKFRLNINKYESVISLVCGLVRLRIGALILDVLKFDDSTSEMIINQLHLWSDLLTENECNLDFSSL
ncbi:transposase family protein [Moorena sp. SIO4G3]|uniref:transposase family protein n=1 Tax=Moorena sp. SIO4G3 TaxID=2607821 RepID=UPI0025E85FEF|nr:transposase family protein [Moorena sp. SIO4G3]